MNSSQIKSGEKLREKYGKNEETKLPPGYEWRVINVQSDDLALVTEFLNQNFREIYVMNITVERIRWETMGRGFFVCITKDNDISGCLGITERQVQINSTSQRTGEAIYLCSSTELRETGITKVLINETIRQAVLAGYEVGSFCDSIIVPSPVATVRYYTRPLNYKHLKANEFVGIGEVEDDVAHDRIKIKLRAPRSIYLAEKSAENVELVHRLYSEYMNAFNLHHPLTIEEVENYFFDDRYVKTIFYEDDNGKVVDFLCYRYFDIINTERENTDEKYDNIIRATSILTYSSNYHRPDILIINAFKVISSERHHLVYIPDMMGSNEVILSNVKKTDEDTDDEEENAMFDQHIMKSRKKQFINLFNWRTPLMTQEMVSYLIFN